MKNFYSPTPTSVINFVENTMKRMVRKDVTSFLPDLRGCSSVLDIHRGKHRIRMKTEIKRLFWKYIFELSVTEELIYLLGHSGCCPKVSIVL